MRKFFLQNAEGETWSLMRFDAFFHSPSGLGFDQKITSIRVGSDWLETDSYLERHTISGEMVFQGYSTYRQFVSFIAHEPLTLTYQPEETEYYIRCKVQTIGKTEIGAQNRLICPIAFICSGTWFERAVYIAQADQVSGAKAYPYTYDYKYYDSGVAGAVIQNGAFESPLVLHIPGPVTDPSWSLVHNGVTVATGSVTATIAAGKKLVIDARPETLEIAEYTTGDVYVRDLYGYSNFSTERFLYAPPGESIVTIISGGTPVTGAVVEVEKRARTV